MRWGIEGGSTDAFGRASFSRFLSASFSLSVSFAGWTVELLVIYMDKTRLFERRLPEDTRKAHRTVLEPVEPVERAPVSLHGPRVCCFGLKKTGDQSWQRWDVCALIAEMANAMKPQRSMKPQNRN